MTGDNVTPPDGGAVALGAGPPVLGNEALGRWAMGPPPVVGHLGGGKGGR